MASIRSRLLAGAFLFAAPAAALAAGEYVVDRVQISGNHLLSTETLLSAVQSHPGARVTQDEILADRDAIGKLYAEKHMGAIVKAAIATRNGNHATVMYTITSETAAAAPAAAPTGLKLQRMTFTGNNTFSEDDLRSILGEAPGAPVTDDTLKADAQKIFQAYKAKDVGVKVTYSFTYPTPGAVDVAWVITETKGKKKRPKILEDSDQGTRMDPD
jgi:outer membrane protein assembly factor BamA